MNFGPVEVYLRDSAIVEDRDFICCFIFGIVWKIRSSVWLPKTCFMTEKHTNETF